MKKIKKVTALNANQILLQPKGRAKAAGGGHFASYKGFQKYVTFIQLTNLTFSELLSQEYANQTS